jgi:hypothetical protein
VLKKEYPNAVAMVIYTDGGPDHNNKHTSVRLGLLALFLELDLDTMVVMRTAPTQSWANPVERVMSVVNLGLQGDALSRRGMDEDYKKIFKKCKGMKAVRQAACDFEQPHPPTTIVEEVHTVKARETSGTDLVVDVVEDAHRDEARDEDDEQPLCQLMTAEEVGMDLASEIAGTDLVVDAVEDAHRDEARDEDDEQPHPHATSVEEVDIVVVSETAGTSIVVDAMADIHRDEARYEDGDQPHPLISSAKEVDTVDADETNVTDVVVDVVDDSRCDEARSDCDDADDYFWNNDDDEALDVDENDNDEECEVLLPSRDPISIQPSTEQLASHQPIAQNQDSIDLTTEGDLNPFIEAYRASIQPAIDSINGQWSDCIWDKSNLIIEAPAHADEV